MTAASVLLVPKDERLLMPGPCWSQPPIAWRHTGGPRWFPSHAEAMEWWLEHMDTNVRPDLLALALKWEGQPVPIGIDRAHRLLNEQPIETGHHVLELGAFDDSAEGLAYTLDEFGLGRIVLLDAEGRELPVVPRIPGGKP